MIRLSRPNANGGQTDTDPIEKPSTRIIGEQELGHRLLGSVAGQRGGEKFIPDDIRKRGAEYGDARGEYQPGLVRRFRALLTNGFKELACAIEIDPVTLAEVSLGLSGDHCR